MKIPHFFCAFYLLTNAAARVRTARAFFCQDAHSTIFTPQICAKLTIDIFP